MDEHVAHALAFASVLGPVSGLVADLGSGGGVPALVLAEAWPQSQWLLVESQRRRSEFLRQAVESLGMESRVRVLEDRAELVGRGQWRACCALVTARSFGSAGVTAECAAPLLVVGGRLVISEPPGGDQARWDTGRLADLGMTPPEIHLGPPALAVLRQDQPCPDRYPRRVGIPAKRPLF